jgi:hypothetical protein
MSPLGIRRVEIITHVIYLNIGVKQYEDEEMKIKKLRKRNLLLL